MNLQVPRSTIRSLYRSLLREANRLPYEYLRVFFRVKFRDDVDEQFRGRSDTVEIRKVKLKRLQGELRGLQAANRGQLVPLNRVLESAYGRRGKLRQEMTEPFLSNSLSEDEKPPPIIPGVEKSRPPVYSPELTALLTSTHARAAKPINHNHLKNPRGLPERANPKSEDARLLGPFSKRREVNTRWRFFAREVGKIRPPFEVTVREVEMTSNGEPQETHTNRLSQLLDLGVQPGAFQDCNFLDKLKRMVEPPPRILTRRERKALLSSNETASNEENHLQARLPTRYLRRRHQDVLGKIPILTYSPKSSKGVDGRTTKIRGKFDVSILDRAFIVENRNRPSRFPFADKDHLTWLRRSEELDKTRKAEEK